MPPRTLQVLWAITTEREMVRITKVVDLEDMKIEAVDTLEEVVVGAVVVGEVKGKGNCS